MVRAIFSGLVTPWEIPRLIQANNISLEAMNEELLGLDLARSVPSTGVPVLFFLGRYDQHTDGRLAATYFATLCAPVKRLVWFEKSAHNVPFEEPRLFNGTVVRELESIGVRLAAGEGVQRKMTANRCGIEAETVCMSCLNSPSACDPRCDHRRRGTGRTCCRFLLRWGLALSCSPSF